MTNNLRSCFFLLTAALATSAASGCVDDGNVDESGYAIDEADDTDVEIDPDRADSTVPFCQSQTISWNHIAMNHVFGEGNLTGYTRARGVGDVKLAQMAKTNISGWHGAWDNRADAEASVREVMKKGCGELVAWARDAAVGATLPLTKSTSGKKGLTCNPQRECFTTGTTRIIWKKINEYWVQTPNGRTKTVELVVTTGFPFVNR